MSGTDLHEHAEARLQQVGETAGHVLDVGTLPSVRVEDLLQDLPQEGTIDGLQDKKHRATRQHAVNCRCDRERKIETEELPRFFFAASARPWDGCGRVINLPLAGESLQKEQRKCLQG